MQLGSFTFKFLPPRIRLSCKTPLSFLVRYISCLPGFNSVPRQDTAYPGNPTDARYPVWCIRLHSSSPLHDNFQIILNNPLHDDFQIILNIFSISTRLCRAQAITERHGLQTCFETSSLCFPICRALPLNAMANYQFTIVDPFFETIAFLHRVCPQNHPGFCRRTEHERPWGRFSRDLDYRRFDFFDRKVLCPFVGAREIVR